MPRIKTYVIHAVVRYVLKSTKDGRTESGEARPTISVDASSEQAAINKARKAQIKRVESPYWKCVSLVLIPELVKVAEVSHAS